ncbi:MAG: MBL fold metallo-hydrolase [Caldilineaceae bacterium]|nr:MBL fold metallo-hydrolase [Caldilineaceae bacterium]
MEIAPGLHRIEAPLGDRFVATYLLVGAEDALLIDTGMDDTPRTYIAPYLDAIDVPLAKIRYVLTSHADFDHTAGNASLKELVPGALFLCHALDQPMVEDIDVMIRDRYGEFAADHGIDETDDAKASIRANSRHVPVNLTLQGGETIRLGADWEVQVLHTPGHSRGHLSVYDPRSNSLVICDATLWNAVLRKDGKPAFPPTYRYVDTYLASMNRFRAMQVDRLLTSHYPVYHGAGVAEFLAESRAYVDRVDQALLDALAGASTPPTMRELCTTLGPKLGEWPAEASIYLVNPFQSHLERLVQYGTVKTGRRDGLMTYQLA